MSARTKALPGLGAPLGALWILAAVIGTAVVGTWRPALEPAEDFGPWTVMASRQVGVPLRPGVTGVEVRDRLAGWTERVVVESDGKRVLRGIPEVEAVAFPQPELDYERAEYFRTRVGPVTGRTTLDRAVRLARWCAGVAYRQPIPRDRESRDLVLDDDGRVVLESIENGGRFNCVSLATIYSDAARAAGLTVRRLDLSARHNSPYEGHAVVEVWSDEYGKWIVVDPTFCLYFELDGVPASAFEMHRAVCRREYARVRVVRDEGAPAADPWTYPLNPLLYYRNVYLRVDGEPWLTLFDPYAPAGMVGRGDFLHVLSPAPFTATTPDRITVTERFANLHGRCAVQDLAGVLYVCVTTDAFSYGRFEVRLSGGAAPQFTPEVAAYNTADDALCMGDELVRNPRLVDADSDSVPDWWEIDGAVARVETGADGSVTLDSGDEECALSARVPGAVGVALAASARLRVECGSVTFGLRRRPPHDSVVAGVTPTTTISPILLAPQNHHARVQLVLSPHTRCTIERVSIRRARLLGDLVRREPPAAPSERS